MRRSNGGLDVLVQPKQVGRVILVLQSDKTFVVAAVSSLDPGSFLYIQMVDVDLTGCKRFDCRPDLARPLDMIGGLPGVVPLRRSACNRPDSRAFQVLPSQDLAPPADVPF